MYNESECPHHGEDCVNPWRYSIDNTDNGKFKSQIGIKEDEDIIVVYISPECATYEEAEHYAQGFIEGTYYVMGQIKEELIEGNYGH